jgi:hypothetical protein
VGIVVEVAKVAKVVDVSVEVEVELRYLVEEVKVVMVWNVVLVLVVLEDDDEVVEAWMIAEVEEIIVVVWVVHEGLDDEVVGNVLVLELGFAVDVVDAVSGVVDVVALDESPLVVKLVVKLLSMDVERVVSDDNAGEVVEEMLLALVVEVVNVDVVLVLLPQVDGIVVRELDEDEITTTVDEVGLETELIKVELIELDEELEAVVENVDEADAAFELLVELLVVLKSSVVVDVSVVVIEEVDIEKDDEEDAVEASTTVKLEDDKVEVLSLDELWYADVVSVVCEDVDKLETEDSEVMDDLNMEEPVVVDEVREADELDNVSELRNVDELRDVEEVRVTDVVKPDQELTSVDDIVADDADDENVEDPVLEATVLDELLVSVEVADVLDVPCDVGVSELEAIVALDELGVWADLVEVFDEVRDVEDSKLDVEVLDEIAVSVDVLEVDELLRTVEDSAELVVKALLVCDVVCATRVEGCAMDEDVSAVNDEELDVVSEVPAMVEEVSVAVDEGLHCW